MIQSDAGYIGAPNHSRREGIRWDFTAKQGRIKSIADGRDKRVIKKRVQQMAMTVSSRTQFANRSGKMAWHAATK